MQYRKLVEPIQITAVWFLDFKRHFADFITYTAQTATPDSGRGIATDLEGDSNIG